MKRKNMTTLDLRKSINRSPLRLAFLLIPLALGCFALSPAARAVCQEGCDSSLFNAFLGDDALINDTSGAGNSAFGWRALFSDTDGSFNTAVGGGALIFNNGSSNTAVGAAALLLNSTGSNNTAVGTDALVNNTVDDNTAVGFFALQANTTGGTLETGVFGLFDIGPNTAVGSGALENNVDGSANTAVGYNALHSQVSGDVAKGFPQLAINTAVGFEALANLTGSAAGVNAANTALGYQALSALTDGYSNVAVGASAGIGLTTGSHNVFIGQFQGPDTADESFHTYVKNINSTTVTDDPVYVDLSTGLLGHLSSSRRYKEDIKPMNNASEALYRLKPVTYRYKKDVDRTQRIDYGLIAEEVAKVDPSLAVRDGQGQIESVRYTAVNAMLLNEFLKEHRKNEEQEKTIVELKSGMTALAATVKEQAAQIQKVSAQLEMGKPAPQVVNNP
jgi:trimeric autotransporter adhesin